MSRLGEFWDAQEDEFAHIIEIACSPAAKRHYAWADESPAHGVHITLANGHAIFVEYDWPDQPASDLSEDEMAEYLDAFKERIFVFVDGRRHICGFDLHVFGARLDHLEATGEWYED